MTPRGRIPRVFPQSYPKNPLRQRSRYGRPEKNEKRPRTNEQIGAAEVLLITEGVGTERLPLADAIARAREQELDLIEVSAKSDPPVVKIGDVGHFMYQAQKKEKRQKSHNKQTEVKMLRFGFRTEKHDLDRIADRAREFMSERHLVKLVVRLRGRELTNKSYAVQKLKQLMTDLMDVAEVEQDVKPQGTHFIAVMRPKRT